MTKIDRNELRILVRQALKEALGEDSHSLPVSGRPAPNPAPQASPEKKGTASPTRNMERDKPAAGSGSGAAPDDFVGRLRRALDGGQAGVTVAVASPADLDRFARDLLAASRHRDLKAAIASGRIRFEPRGNGRSAPAAAEPRAPEPSREGGSRGGQDTFQMDAGVLGEAALVRIGRTHTRILIGNDVVVTPLAREKARAMKVEIERRTP